MSGSALLHKFAYNRRRYWRLLAAIACIAIFFRLSQSPNTRLSQLRIVESSHDWSKYEPHHPLSSLQRLPRAKPRKLPRIQYTFNRFPSFGLGRNDRRRESVKLTFQKCWNHYRQMAWMRDELAPLTGVGRDTFGGWSATMIDSMDTLWIMGLHREYEEAVEAVITIDWAKVQGTSCNMFETTIRHLGGLLSAYDFSHVPALLQKATELGDMLYAGFDTPNHMPPFWFDFQKAKVGALVPDDYQPAASAASLSLEFTRLAQLTGDDKYYDAVARVTEHLRISQNTTKLPGLWPTFFNLKDGIFDQDDTFTLGALSDSMYEYILKMYILLGATESRYEELYRTTADAIIKHLVFRPMTPENLDILFTGTYRAERSTPFDPEGQHLACFAGGMFAMGGKMFQIPEHVDVGARLAKGCVWAYNAFPTGIAPEIFKLIPCETLSGCEWDQEKWLRAVASDNEGNHDIPKGFQNTRDPRYILRPEALESVFILYRITGQKEYREYAWSMFQSIQRATETNYGNAAIADVTAKGTPLQIDSMESFWMAETLKYLYLIFSPSNTISLDDFVFNTEAHPFRIPK